MASLKRKNVHITNESSKLKTVFLHLWYLTFLGEWAQNAKHFSKDSALWLLVNEMRTSQLLHLGFELKHALLFWGVFIYIYIFLKLRIKVKLPRPFYLVFGMIAIIVIILMILIILIILMILIILIILI